MRKLLLFSVLWMNIIAAMAQGSYVPLGSYSVHVLDRMEIKQGRLATPQEYNTATKAYLRGSIASYADSFDTQLTTLSKQDKFNLQYLQTDNFEYSNSAVTLSKKGLFGTPLYKHKAAFFDVDIPDFKLVINPVLYLKAEHDQSQQTIDYINTRGLEIRGQIGKKLSFYTMIADEIQKLNSWNQEYYNKDSVIPGQAYLKTPDNRTFNYFLASGYISFKPIKYIDIQFGQGRNFIGNGYRSLMMSDFSRDNLFLRINTRIWRINYTNIWGETIDYVSNAAYNFPKRHYYATTYANVNITKKLSIGLFQTISFQRDSGYADGGFDPQYLNPIIFYKAVENGLNSPDKAILGADFKYNFAKHFSVYGQFVLSEFTFEKVFAKEDSLKGSFANKYGYQIGIKYIDVLNVPNLDLQYEFNWLRPYMYTSYTSLNAYVNYNQNMAHPLGANFRENIIIVRYQPVNKLNIMAKTIISMYGNDTMGSNWGKDIRKNYYTYERAYGNVVGQGATTYLYIGELSFSYMVWHNMFVDFACVYRKTKSAVKGFGFDTQTFNPSIGLRWNINYRGCEF
jgi:hypothetical protein